MKAEALLALYERVADAPEAILRLRRFVLDLAVRGRLTEYRRSTREECALGEAAEFVMGQAPPGDTCNSNGDGMLFVKVGEFGARFPEARAWTTQPLKTAREGDVLICVVGATVGKLNLGVSCAIGRSVAAIRPQLGLDTEYLYLSLMPFTLTLREGSRGSAQGVISRKDLEAIQIWIPPLAEQHRIVAKVDELMALLDRLEAARSAREATRDRLTTASLTRLTAPDTDSEALRTNARFALEALPALTNRADQIKQLRQTILNLAVRGKLLEQEQMPGGLVPDGTLDGHPLDLPEGYKRRRKILKPTRAVFGRDFFGRRFQPVNATACRYRSVGVSNFSVLRGRSFSCLATRSSCVCVKPETSIPFGKYCRNKPLVFSFDPRCHGLCGSQK